MIDLSIVIVNWNTRGLLAECLESIEQTVTGMRFEVLVVDNGSTDGSAEMVRQAFPHVRLIVNRENAGFVRANNQAIPLCQGRYLLLLNSDARLLPGAVTETLRCMAEQPRAGVVGLRLLNGDGSFQASYTPFPTLWREFLILSGLGRLLVRRSFPSYGPRIEQGAQPVDGYVEGAYLLLRREAVEQVGALDEHIVMYAEEVDWCYRFRQAGWEVWYLPQATVVHHGGQSSKRRRSRMEAELYRSRVYFFHKHYGRAAARRLTALIYTFTAVKIVVHGLLRRISGGRRGRVVTDWRELQQALQPPETAQPEVARP